MATKKTDSAEKKTKQTVKKAVKEAKKTAKKETEKKEIKKTVKKAVKKILKDTKKQVKKAEKENAAAVKMVDLIEKTLTAGKAEDVVVLDLTGKTALADYLVVATGRSPRHVTALAEQVQMRLKKTGVPALLEGEDVGDGVIVDAGDVIVHVFHPETRDLYRIEELWGGETPHRAK